MTKKFLALSFGLILGWVFLLSPLTVSAKQTEEATENRTKQSEEAKQQLSNYLQTVCLIASQSVRDAVIRTWQIRYGNQSAPMNNATFTVALSAIVAEVLINYSLSGGETKTSTGSGSNVINRTPTNTFNPYYYGGSVRPTDFNFPDDDDDDDDSDYSDDESYSDVAKEGPKASIQERAKDLIEVMKSRPLSHRSSSVPSLGESVINPEAPKPPPPPPLKYNNH